MTTLPEVPTQLDEVISAAIRIESELREANPRGDSPSPELVLGLVELAFLK